MYIYLPKQINKNVIQKKQFLSFPTNIFCWILH